MKLGFLALGLSDIAKAGQFGFPGIEMDANAFGNLAEPVAEATIEEAKALCATHNVEITAIAFYDVAWTPAVQADPQPYYRNLMQLAKTLDVPVISSMSGFDGSLDWKGNLELFKKRFESVCAQAEEHGLKIALENWMRSEER